MRNLLSRTDNEEIPGHNFCSLNLVRSRRLSWFRSHIIAVACAISHLQWKDEFLIVRSQLFWLLHTPMGVVTHYGPCRYSINCFRLAQIMFFYHLTVSHISAQECFFPYQASDVIGSCLHLICSCLTRGCCGNCLVSILTLHSNKNGGRMLSSTLFPTKGKLEVKWHWNLIR